MGMFDDTPFEGYSETVLAERERIGKPNCELVGQDGNAFAIMGRVGHALKRAGYSQQAVNEYQEASTRGDYNELLRVAMDWVEDVGEDVEDDDDEW